MPEPNRELTFTLNGTVHRLTPQQVATSVEGWPPPPVKKYGVRIGRRTFPIKDVLAKALRIPPASFTSQQAYGILMRLGFEIETRA